MHSRVAIVGVGFTPFRSITPDISFKEMMYEASMKAYEDAGITSPQREVDAFVTCEEDFEHGRSIFNMQTPDNVGCVLKPGHTIPADGIHGIIEAFMEIRSGLYDVVAVESHSKASNVLNRNYLIAHALDPIYTKPLDFNPYFIAGMEMNRYLFETGSTRKQCASVVVKNKANAFQNPMAVYAERTEVADVLDSEAVCHPLTRMDMSSNADGGIAMVLASEEKARILTEKPIWIRGVGWSADAPGTDKREWGEAVYAKLAGEMAYRIAGISNPRKEIDFAEIDDTFSYKELQHMEALKLCHRGEAGLMLEEGATQARGEFPINVSGGSLGVGLLAEATGLQRILEVVLQLRGEAGKRQLPSVRMGLAQSWRGIPGASGAVIVLNSE